MGMTIDEAERYLRLMLGGMKYAVRYWKDKDKEESDIEQTNVEAVKTALDTMHKYQMMQAEYEARIKADMVAMLTEIQLEIEEREQYYQDEFLKSKNAVRDAAMGGRMFGCGDCIEIIQQKINVLKAEKEDT